MADTLRHPGGQLQHPPRQQRLRILYAVHVLERRLGKLAVTHGHAVGEPQPVAATERHPHPAARLDLGRELLRHEVVERLVDAVRQHDGGDRAAAGVVFDPLRPALEQLALARMLMRHAGD